MLCGRGLIYSFAYHINELFQASLLAEYAAVSVLPFASLLPNESVTEVENVT